MMSSIAETWGTEPHERSLAFPCDGIIPRPEATLYRGITIAAPPQIVFRWLCQMRVAPYSYDWIDNGGRQSPRVLTPGLDDLVVGQDLMSIFDLVGFEPERHLTLCLKPQSRASRTFGEVVISYVIVPIVERGSTSRSRLLVKVTANYPRGLQGMLMRAFLPWGDLIMMRRQLLNFKQLAEKAQTVVTDDLPVSKD